MHEIEARKVSEIWMWMKDGEYVAQVERVLRAATQDRSTAVMFPAMMEMMEMMQLQVLNTQFKQ